MAVGALLPRSIVSSTSHRTTSRVATRPRLRTGGAVPTGLEEASFAIRIPETAVDSKRAFATWKSLPFALKREDGRGMRGVARGERRLSPFHAHFSLDHEDERNEYIFRLELTKGTHGAAERRLPRISEFLEDFRSYLREPDRRYRGLLGANFNFSLRKWRPSFSLPFSVPGTFDHVPGLPQISGLDFSFADTRPEQSLRRAFVTTYAGIDEMVLKLLFSHASPISGQLADEILSVANAHRPIFVAQVGADAE